MSSEPTVYYLEMLSPEALQPGAVVEGFELKRVQPADAELNRRYYEAVGADWKWTDRLQWSCSDWQAHVAREELHTYVGFIEDNEVGYAELEQQPQGGVQLVYFGLLPDHYGRGLGGALLTAAIEAAWELSGTERLWLHTCTDDHEHALANYQKRGFVVYETKNPSPAD